MTHQVLQQYSEEHSNYFNTMSKQEKDEFQKKLKDDFLLRVSTKQESPDFDKHSADLPEYSSQLEILDSHVNQINENGSIIPTLQSAVAGTRRKEPD